MLPQEFLLDSQNHFRDAIGMVGQRLEVNVHIVTSAISATQNLVTAANRAGVVVCDTVLEPLASAESSLTQDERELGCCLLDIGGGSTDLIRLLRRHGAPRAVLFQLVAITSPTISRSVSARRFLKPSASSANMPALARAAVGEDSSIEIASVGDRPPRTIFTRMLNDIVEPRAHELLSMVRDEVKRAGLDKQIPAGIVLAGGGSRLQGIGPNWRTYFFVARPSRDTAWPAGITRKIFTAGVCG